MATWGLKDHPAGHKTNGPTLMCWQPHLHRNETTHIPLSAPLKPTRYRKVRNHSSHKCEFNLHLSQAPSVQRHAESRTIQLCQLGDHHWSPRCKSSLATSWAKRLAMRASSRWSFRIGHLLWMIGMIGGTKVGSTSLKLLQLTYQVK